MTVEEMRALVDLPPEASDAAVVMAFAALIDQGSAWPVDAVEPVTVEMVRLQCRLDHEFEDDLIEDKIVAAREWVEDHTGQILVKRPLAERFTRWGDRLEIFKRPVRSIDAVAYDGVDGATLHAAAAASSGGYPIRIYPGPNAWPRLRVGGGVTVIFTAGFAADKVPARYKEAVLVLVAGMMGGREGGYDQSVAAAKALCARGPSRV